MQRINIIGTTGSGKTTFARRLSKTLSIPHIEMDQVFWNPNWQHKNDEEYFPLIEQAVAESAWIMDGNYTRTTDIKWQRADTVIWLDYHPLRNFLQLFSRACNRAITGKELWSGTGNKESFGRMFSRESILLWFFKTYWRNKKRYPKMMADTKYSHIQFIRLKSPRQAQALLAKLA